MRELCQGIVVVKSFIAAAIPLKEVMDVDHAEILAIMLGVELAKRCEIGTFCKN